MSSSNRSALLVVDVQNDFCPGGALPVPHGDRVIAVLNRQIEQAIARGWPVYLSRDWHPRVTSHFREHGGDWPVHCVQDTAGAAFHPDLRVAKEAIVITKGDIADTHGYSAFEGHTPDGTPFLDDLIERNINHLYVGGLATDYCVNHSVLDARRAGIAVTVLSDAIEGVDVNPGDSARAISDMQAAGAMFESATAALG